MAEDFGTLVLEGNLSPELEMSGEMAFSIVDNRSIASYDKAGAVRPSKDTFTLDERDGLLDLTSDFKLGLYNVKGMFSPIIQANDICKVWDPNKVYKKGELCFYSVLEREFFPTTEKRYTTVYRAKKDNSGINPEFMADEYWEPFVDYLNENISFKSAEGTEFDLATGKGGIKLNKIDGQTHKSMNLIDISNASSSIAGRKLPQTLPVGTYTISFDQTSTANGFRLSRTTDTSSDSIATANKQTINGRSYLTLTTTFEANYINLSGSEPLNNIMLNDGATPLPYESYGMHSAGDGLGIVDLGTLPWVMSGTKFAVNFQANNIPLAKYGYNNEKLYCDLYTYQHNAVNDKTLFYGSNNALYVHDSAYTDATVFKNAMQGVKLVYELADGVTADTYALQFRENGKNLFVPTLETTSLNGVTCTKNNDGTYTLNGTCSATTGFNLGYINLKANTTYYISGCPSGGSDSKYKFDGIANYETVFKDIGNGTYINSLNTDRYTQVRIVCYAPTVFNNLVFKPMISINEVTYNDYQPYQTPDIINLPLSAPLRSVGDIKDELIVNADGTGKIIRRLGGVDLSSLNWTYYADWGGNPAFGTTDLSGKYKAITDSEVANWICDKYTIYARTYLQNNNSINGIAGHWQGIYVTVRDSSLSSTDKPKGMLVYELATPTEEILTAEQLKAIFSLVSFKDNTTLTTADGLAKMYIDYGKDEATATILENSNKSNMANIPIEQDTSLISDKWSNTKTYTQGEYCISKNSLWKSKVNNNLGNVPTEGSYWTATNVSAQLKDMIVVSSHTSAKTTVNGNFGITATLSNEGYKPIGVVGYNLNDRGLGGIVFPTATLIENDTTARMYGKSSSSAELTVTFYVMWQKIN